MLASRIGCVTVALLIFGCSGLSDALQLCGADMVLTEYASSQEDALTSRTTDSGAAFAMMPHIDLKRCGIRGGKDVGIDRSFALSRCGEMPGCFGVDYYPKEKGGTAFYCVEAELQSFGSRADKDETADMAHFYKVAGTSCSSLVSDQVASCDGDGVLTNRATSRADVLQSRTTSPTAAFASVLDDFLANCGKGEKRDVGVSRGEAVAKCKARSDCFSIDFYPEQDGGSAHYCTDASLVSLQNTKTAKRLRGGSASRVSNEHIYKVKGTTCSCTSASHTGVLVA